jgi:hypothetical protein
VSNATSIFNAARALVGTTLGASYKEHPNIMEYTELDARSLDGGYAVVLMDITERNPQVNDLFIQRKLRVTVTHRTYASIDAAKVIAKLQAVYDKEAELIDEIRCWVDQSIGLIKVIPNAETTIETFEEEEDSFLVNTLNFDIIYVN